MSSPEIILSFKDVAMHFGGVKAIDGLSFSVEKGRIFGIIGPNGAGKTTVFNVLSGMYIPTEGEVRYRDKLINRLPPHVVAAGGIARTFQNIRLFEQQTVLDNLKVARYSQIRYGLPDVFLNSSKKRREEDALDADCYGILDFLGLETRAALKAGSLPYGEQRKVEIARALSCKPELMLLDEPAAGMNPAEIDELNRLILGIRDHFNLTILLVEHQMRLVMEICDEIMVMNFGKKMALGDPASIRNNDEVLEAYLGKVHAQ
jgi:branched-chain amino acid transport system ATP-binding protein